MEIPLRSLVMHVLGLLVFALPLGYADEYTTRRHEADPRVNALLAPIREKYALPGIVGGIVVEDQLVAIGAVGVRKLGSPEKITVDDQGHIGSEHNAVATDPNPILARPAN